MASKRLQPTWTRPDGDADGVEARPAGMASKRLQPTWTQPGGDADGGCKLMLHNSLTRKKEPFVPQHGKRVTWYNCGPTVYDASHMGHARTYLTFDILRRVLQNYFGYDIFFVMNITDIDDKIIKRARQNHLYEEYCAAQPTLEQALKDCKSVLEMFAQVVAKETDADKKAMRERQFSDLKSGVSGVSSAVSADDSAAMAAAQERLLAAAKEPLADWLDKRSGAEVTDKKIFAALPKFWEEKFHQDMEALNILPADCLTRVSEFVPEIVAYIERIIARGFAYAANGSVYFDVGRFDGDRAHHYAKLVPEAFGDSRALEEGEGDLTVDRVDEKRSGNDFALWKLSKPGEPSWESPWGRGRPGWHIECSVMASDVLGQSIDIHTGGFDLKFPHHDNELAQSEAYFDNDHWIRYFLHSGHLTIAGCKMSKSLKNFITIEDVLQKYTARQLRLTFLMHAWKDTLDYSDETMEHAKSYEKTVNEFFLTTKHILRTTGGTGMEAFRKWTGAEVKLNRELQTCQTDVHRAFCDNIDTRSALESLRLLVAAGNAYIEGQRRAPPPARFNRALLKTVSSYITSIFDVLGLISRNSDAVGFPATDAAAAAADGCANVEDIAMPYLSALSDFRESIRRLARETKATAILAECDKLRDDVLPELGVRLEDKENEPVVIKLVDKAELAKEREAKRAAEEAKRLEKSRKKAESSSKAATAEAQRRMPPNEMFRADTDKYSKFDEKGLPTHNASGEELAKSQMKKLQKLYQAQEKKYNEYLKTHPSEQ